MYLESGLTRSTASKRELQIKKMTRAGKYQLISSEMNELSHPHEIVLPPERGEERNMYQ
jgi:predicted GIY-YIG superfamily endonuclease